MIRRTRLVPDRCAPTMNIGFVQKPSAGAVTIRVR
jgi:hypothetical protein